MFEPVESSVLVRRTEEFFGPQTPLVRAPEFGGRPYEPRPQQVAMAVRVAECLATGRHLCVEAPTGVGKTFAYLVPAALLAAEHERPVVVSTHTISLQEQIMRKDAPILQRLLGFDFKVVLAKGRGNYLCLRRLLAAAGNHQEYLPSADLLPELARLQAWSQETRDGSRSDLPFEPAPFVWEAVACEAGNCMGQNCRYFASCFFMRARLALLHADIIVANHALFFSDMQMKRGDGDEEAGEVGILPAFAAAILDEGQTVEDTAATHLGLRLTSGGLRRALHRLYNPDRNRGLLVDVSCTQARMAVIKTLDTAERFFSQVATALGDTDATGPYRYQQPGQIPDLLALPLETVGEELRGLAKNEVDESRRQELKALGTQLQEYRESLHTFTEMALEKHVYWLERQGSQNRNLIFNAVPVDVAPLLRRLLFAGDFTVVVTSATLAVRKSMAYFVSRIGAEEAETQMLDSPFDFQQQVVLHLARSLPNPSETAQFIPAVCDQLRRFLKQTDGHAFVLFTSYRMLQDVADRLAEFCRESRYHLLVQGDGMPRTRLLETFRTTPRSVLFGTDSFWTGVDVPGDALVNVIIVKLPFAVPDHPLIQARCELIEARGGSAFQEYSLPEAVLKFRQGFGRLIRSRDDHGIVVVLDNRIVRSRYGAVFLDSLPPCRQVLF